MIEALTVVAVFMVGLGLGGMLRDWQWHNPDFRARQLGGRR